MQDSNMKGTSKRYVRMDKTENDACIGDGAYGVVYRALDVVKNERVALKRIRLEGEDEGIPATALREITLLKTLHHENVVNLRDHVYEEGRLYIVFELAELDLKKYMKATPGPMDPGLVQQYSRQILEGLAYCHSRGVMHRDLKPQNILVNSTGSLKLADFGLARTFSPNLRPLTVEVITRWYRAPEILFGCRSYTPSVDDWSVACIIAEMAEKEALLPGDSEIDQLHKTFKLLGTPTDREFPGVTEFPFWRNNFPDWKPMSMTVRLPTFCPIGCDLISKLLIYDPRKRLSSYDALTHPYITGSGESSFTSRMRTRMSFFTPKNENVSEKQLKNSITVEQARVATSQITNPPEPSGANEDSGEVDENAIGFAGISKPSLTRTKSYNFCIANGAIELLTKEKAYLEAVVEDGDEILPPISIIPELVSLHPQSVRRSSRLSQANIIPDQQDIQTSAYRLPGY